MEEDLRARLRANAALTDLVGQRIEWIDRPQAAALPSVTLQVITSGRSYTYDGASDLTGTRIQIDCWGSTYASAKAVSRAVIAALEPPAVQGGTRFSASFLDNAPDFPPEDMPGGTKAYRVNMDWAVWHSPN